MKGVLARADWLEIRRRVGGGAFGVVFEAWDRRRESRVAVKVPRSLDAETLYRFKREFRALAGIRHPNLVALYDLVSDGDEWLFSMEFIDGMDLWRHLRTERAAEDESSFDRVRNAFAQIAAGVGALHAAGILHRDLKPSNVLVASDGRVVLVDFGLVKELSLHASSTKGSLTGTLAYLAPEQLTADDASPASDWYGVGVMLYESLAGRLPPGWSTPLGMFEAKRSGEVEPPHALAKAVPLELSALCHELLRRDPVQRPGRAEILDRLAAPSSVPAAGASVGTEPRLPLIGRERHLHVLTRAFADSRQGRSVTVHVHGRSGMGKTALVQRFVQEVRALEPRTIVLAGSCYERESVPYKALDSLVDELGHHLARAPSLEAARMVPRDVRVLARLFPVLGGVEAIAAAPERDVEVPNAQELRRRAAAALRELLARIADERPLVLVIDDLQWGDVDSAVVLNELLRSPDPPPLLLLLCYRSEDVGGSHLPERLNPAADTWTAGGARIELEVGELSRDESHALATNLLIEMGADVPRHAAVVAGECGGSPFLLGELVRHAAAGRAVEGREPSLDDMIHARAAEYPDEARRLLEIVAVAGGPLPVRVARGAAGLDAEEAPALVHLRVGRLVRTRQIDGRDEVETYHDRIREAVVRRLAAASLREHHERLALSWELVGGADPETLATHWEHAGAMERASRYTIDAATQAAAALAFDRAARLYRRSLELPRPATPAEERWLRVQLGDALANAGRGAAAAEAYLAAVKVDAESEDALELQRRAAQQLLISGHIDDGLAVLRRVLGALDLRLARTPRRALGLFLLRQAQLAARGLRFVERPQGTLSSDEIRLLDTCWAAVTGLSMVDTMRAAHFQARHLLMALRAGEPYRLTRALTLQAGLTVLRGRRSWRRTEALLRQAEALAERLEHPHARGMCRTMRAATISFRGQYREALDLARAGETLLRGECTGVTWELDTAVIFQLHSLYWMGEWAELGRRLPALLREAEDRGDLYLSTYLGTRSFYVLLLAADQPAEAMARQERSIDAWSQQGFQVQHYWDWLARGEIDLYAGRADAAWRRVQDQWRTFVRSHLDANQAIFIESRLLRARAALAAAVTGEPRAREALLRQVARDARTIERERVPWAEALARLLRAALAATAGDARTATALATAAETEFDALDMAQYAAALRYRRGQMTGGEAGRRLVGEAERWMRGQGVGNAERMTHMLAPGIWSRG